MQLLALLGIGFMQGLYALDAADGQAEHLHEVNSTTCSLRHPITHNMLQVVHVLIQALLQYVA